MFLSEGKLLDESDLTLLLAYTLKVEDGITNSTFNKLCFAFPQTPLLQGFQLHLALMFLTLH